MHCITYHKSQLCKITSHEMLVFMHVWQSCLWSLLPNYCDVRKFIYVMWSNNMSQNSQILFLRYSQTKPIVSFVSYCLFNPLTVCIFGTNCPISGVFTKLIPKQYPNRKCQKKKKNPKNHIFWLQTHFAWLHHIFVLVFILCSESYF